MTPPGLSSRGDLPLWVAGVWHQMGCRAETAQDRGGRLLQSSSYLAPYYAAPRCLRVYRPALPCLGLRDLHKADCRSHPSCRGLAQHLWGPPQLLCVARSQEHLLRCGSAATITSRDAEPSPGQVLHPPRPFPAGKVLSSLLFRNLVQQLNLSLFFRVCRWQWFSPDVNQTCSGLWCLPAIHTSRVTVLSLGYSWQLALSVTPVMGLYPNL